MIDGERLALSRLRGSVVLAVNTASRCGYTPQFEGLESLYRAKAASGFTIVGFPSNDFRQELAKDGAIADFCTLNYGVSFPMASRSRVRGPKANALFAAIAARPAPAGEEPAWNFTKYLIDRSGRLAARYPSSVEPDDPGLRGAVQPAARGGPRPLSDRLRAEREPIARKVASGGSRSRQRRRWRRRGWRWPRRPRTER